MTPKRIHYNRFDGQPLPEGAILVTRGKGRKWGNPAVIGKFYEPLGRVILDNREACQAFREHLTANPEFVEAAKRELAGHDLACACKAGEMNCHGQILLELVNPPQPKDCRGFLQQHGADALRQAAVDAEPFDFGDQPEAEHEADPQPEPQPDPAPQPEPQAAPTGKLEKYRADHRNTLGMTWAEIEELRPPAIIDNFLRQGELLLLGAESKSRKSWLTQDAGICVATGLPWLADENGANGFAVKQASVWVFDLELSAAETLFRFAKARGNRWPDDEAAQAAASEAFNTFSLDGLNVKDVYPLLDELRGLLKPGDLVIVDCFYRLVPDGNETADVALAMESLKRLASDTGCGVIVVDHFRKAGDDKARNRFAGSFVKQASASTLVAIETKPNDLLEMNVDARTFHGCPMVHARFDLETYTFQRVPEADVAAAKDAATNAEAEEQILKVWRSRSLSAGVGAADAGAKWGITRQAASTRLGKLASRGFLSETDPGPGAAKSWELTPKGVEIIKTALNLKP